MVGCTGCEEHCEEGGLPSTPESPLSSLCMETLSPGNRRSSNSTRSNVGGGCSKLLILYTFGDVHNKSACCGSACKNCERHSVVAQMAVANSGNAKTSIAHTINNERDKGKMHANINCANIANIAKSNVRTNMEMTPSCKTVLLFSRHFDRRRNNGNNQLTRDHKIRGIPADAGTP